MPYVWRPLKRRYTLMPLKCLKVLRPLTKTLGTEAINKGTENIKKDPKYGGQ